MVHALVMESAVALVVPQFCPTFEALLRCSNASGIKTSERLAWRRIQFLTERGGGGAGRTKKWTCDWIVGR